MFAAISVIITAAILFSSKCSARSPQGPAIGGVLCLAGCR
jgi:hypothetical protein